MTFWLFSFMPTWMKFISYMFNIKSRTLERIYLRKIWNWKFTMFVFIMRFIKILYYSFSSISINICFTFIGYWRPTIILSVKFVDTFGFLNTNLLSHISFMGSFNATLSFQVMIWYHCKWKKTLYEYKTFLEILQIK